MAHFAAHLLLVASLITPSAAADIHGMVQAGQTKEEIGKLLGEPYETRVSVKSSRPIWGPEEEFWDRIPEGTRLEVWRYRSEQGHLNLCFPADSDRLGYTAWAPASVVHEPEGSKKRK